MTDRRDTPRLILLRGLPDSGNPTLARRLAEAIPAVRLCADEWMTRLAVTAENTVTGAVTDA